MSSVEALRCVDFVEFVGDYLEGGLESTCRDSFELHEVACVGCQEYHHQLRYTRELIAQHRQRRYTRELIARQRIVEDGQPGPAVGVPSGDRVAAFKFLRRGAVGPFSGFRWPENEWVQAGEPLEACVKAIHACSVADLSYWLNEELWHVELVGGVHEHEHKLVGAFGRLLERVDEWDERRARRFADWCADTVRRLIDGEAVGRASRDESAAVLDEFLGYPEFAAARSVASLAAHLSGLFPGGSGEETERAEQAKWLAQELGLERGAANATP